MHGRLFAYFAGDHQRLDGLLTEAARVPERIDLAAFGQFRAGIVRHIWQEEKILLPAIRQWQQGVPFRDAARLRLDHGAVASLLVPVPSRAIIHALRAIFAAHNPLEEAPRGLYAVCEMLAPAELEDVLARVHAAPELPLMPYNPDPSAMEAMRRALGRAGYDYDVISQTRA